MKYRSDTLAFWGAAGALILVYASSATPIPLYESWRTNAGLSYSDLSLSSVVYFVGAVCALLVFGRISDFLGRRSVSLVALALSALASVLFLFMDGAFTLLSGRLLQGLASGLASTTMTAWIVDSVKHHLRALPPIIISTSPLLGLSIGSLGGGSLISYAAYPNVLVFYVVLALIAVFALVLWFGQESSTPKPGIMQSLKPSFVLPKAAYQWYPAAAIGFTCTWAMGGFYQAFGPTIAATYLHSSTPIAAAMVFASFMAPSILGSTLAGKLSPDRALWIGMTIFFIALVGIVTSLYTHALIPFLMASAIAGSAQGTTMSGGIRCLMNSAQPHERAGTFSVIYGTAYSGAAIPTLIVGQLTDTFSLLQLALGYALLALLGLIAISIIMIKLAQQHNSNEQNAKRITCTQ